MLRPANFGSFVPILLRKSVADFANIGDFAIPDFTD
jgi:hypothetical protein